MNKKLIAVAVASTLVAPAVYADITPYGRINNAIDFKDSDNTTGSTVDVSSVASRFGFKGSADIGNGLTAIGRYEFATVTDKEQPNPADLRLGYVGVSGGFGSVTIGNQWSAYFNHFGTLASPTYSLGYLLYSDFAGGPFRTSNTIKYSNSFGPVSMDFDVRLNDSEEGNDVAEKLNGNGYGLGLTFAATEAISLALSLDSEENPDVTDEETGAVTFGEDTDRVGIAGKMDFGIVNATLAWQTWEQGTDEIDHLQLYVGGAVGEKSSWLVGFGTAEKNSGGSAATEPDSAFLGFYHNMGGGLRLYVEATSVDFDEGDSGDFTQTLLGMRFDF